jgi:hypothetical protein
MWYVLFFEEDSKIHSESVRLCLTNSKHWKHELLEIMYRKTALICLTINVHFLFFLLFRCNN